MTMRDAKFNRMLSIYCAVMALIVVLLIFWEEKVIPPVGYLTPSVSAAKAPGIYLVGINSASKEELEEVPGIGKTLSQAIIDYRETHGPFLSLEQLLEVKGIGEKTFKKFRPYLSLN